MSEGVFHTSIRPLTREGAVEFRRHFKRHRAESGRGDHHFMPFTPDDPDGPRGVNLDALDLPLAECGWQRCFVAFTDSHDIVGHVDLKSDGLKTGLHRCELGIGIERPYRGSGLGRRLMETAIDFATQSRLLEWIDLRVFSHNTAGRALYRRLEFVEAGTITDRFRIEGESIDDVIMSRKLHQRHDR